MFAVVLYDILTVCVLIILLKTWPFGKDEEMCLINSAPTFVVTFKEWGGLNHVEFLDLVRLVLVLCEAWLSYLADPGVARGLLYKELRNSFINSLIH